MLDDCVILSVQPLGKYFPCNVMFGNHIETVAGIMCKVLGSPRSYITHSGIDMPQLCGMTDGYTHRVH